MAYKVAAAESFKREYDAALQYLVEVLDSPQAAVDLMADVKSSTKMMGEFPRARPVSSKLRLASSELREMYVRGYVIVYALKNDTVYLMHFFHQSQDFESLVE